MQRDVPIGGIVAWSGSIINIPDRFVLCDGTNGTPDLRNKFIVGAGDTYAKDAVGGNTTHPHGFTGDSHSHTIATNARMEPGVGIHSSTAAGSTTGTTDAVSSLPPYYSLCYIMYKGV